MVEFKMVGVVERKPHKSFIKLLIIFIIFYRIHINCQYIEYAQNNFIMFKIVYIYVF